MGGYGCATPDWDLWLDTCWGTDVDNIGFGCLPWFVGASNVVVGTNPPYTIQDFLTFYPKFGGVPLTPAATATLGSATLTAVSSTTGIVAGNPVAGVGIPDGATVVSTTSNTIVLSVAATQANVGLVLTVWNNPPIPMVALQAFITLASASLVQARWLSQWTFAMNLFVAHYASLYAQSNGDPTSTYGQIASQGLATGIAVSKSVGDVSVSYQTLQDFAGWGTFALTWYGQQLITMGRLVGAGAMLVY